MEVKGVIVVYNRSTKNTFLAKVVNYRTENNHRRLRVEEYRYDENDFYYLDDKMIELNLKNYDWEIFCVDVEEQNGIIQDVGGEVKSLLSGENGGISPHHTIIWGDIQEEDPLFEST